MNCPKCNAPLKEGDKFCQVCGSAIDNTVNQTQPTPQVSTPQVPTSQVSTPVANQTSNVPVTPNQTVNNPIGGQNMTVNQPVKKQNNPIIYVLVLVIIILMAVIVFFVVSGNKNDNNNNVNSNDQNNTSQPVATNNYAKTNIGGYSLELPEGYNADVSGENVVIYDDEESVCAILNTLKGSLNSIQTANKELVKSELLKKGATNVQYQNETVNNKNLLVYTFEADGYEYEYVYSQASSSTIVYGTIVYYEKTASQQKELHDIISRVGISETSYSIKTNDKFLDIDQEAILNGSASTNNNTQIDPANTPITESNNNT